MSDAADAEGTPLQMVTLELKLTDLWWEEFQRLNREILLRVVW